MQMRIVVLIIFIAFAGSFLGGCAGTSQSTSDVGSAPDTLGSPEVVGLDAAETTLDGIAATDYYAEWYRALCTGIITCGLGELDATFVDKDACFVIMLGLSQAAGLIPDLPAAIASGEVHYDAKQAALCIAANAVACQGPTQSLDHDALPACATVIQGQVANGSACSTPLACANGFCLQPHPTCPGVCTAWRAASESCAAHGECQAGLKCVAGQCSATGWGGTTGACDGNADCAPLAFCESASQGGTCKPKAENGGVCATSDGCAPGLWCTGPGGPEGICEPVTALGAACKTLEECGGGNTCRYAATGLAGVCSKPVGLGASCLTSYECAGFDVACVGPEGPKTCQLLPAKGAECVQAGDGRPLQCMPPAVCGGNYCVDPLPKGSACVLGGLDPCSTGLGCDPLTGTCEPPPGLGESCTTKCTQGLECEHGPSGGKCVKIACK